MFLPNRLSALAASLLLSLPLLAAQSATQAVPTAKAPADIRDAGKPHASSDPPAGLETARQVVAHIRRAIARRSRLRAASSAPLDLRG